MTAPATPADRMRALMQEQPTAALRRIASSIAVGDTDHDGIALVMALMSPLMVERVAAAHGPLDAAVCRAAAMAHAQQGARALAAYWADLDALEGVA